MIGFLFGIPRTLQGDKARLRDIPSRDTENVNDIHHQGRYQANTNLEQISDWLTKILVGVGLTQLILLPSALQYFSATIAPALGGLPSGGTFSIAILIFFSVDGFLIGYLWTRRYFACELEQSDIDLQKMEEMNKFKTEKESEDANNSDALKLSEAVLEPSSDHPIPVTQEELNSKIKLATSFYRAMIYFKAESVRRNNWYNPRDKPIMERTEKIFRALIASDTEQQYYNNHGQLGYVLKDKRIPDWKEALAELTKAIEIRGPWQQENKLWYEFNRAICRIHLDEEFKRNAISTEASKKNIIEDIEVAAHDQEINNVMRFDPTVSTWMDLNNYSINYQLKK